MNNMTITIFGATRHMTQRTDDKRLITRGVVTLAAACCLFAPGANSQPLGLTAQDHAEIERLGLAQTFSSLGEPLFQNVQIVRARAAAYRGLDREMAECVVRGGTRQSCFQWGTALRARILAEHDQAKEAVLYTCEDAKVLPSKLAGTSGYTDADITSARQLLLKMFAAAGVECHVPAPPAARFRPAPQTHPLPAPRPASIGSFWDRVVGGEAQQIAWVKEDLLIYIAAGRNGFEKFKKGSPFLNEAGQKSWQSNSVPALAKNCRIIQLSTDTPNSLNCILTTHSDIEVIRKDYDRFVRYVDVAVPKDWEQVTHPLGEVDSIGWKSKSGMSGEIFIHQNPERNEYSLCYQMLGLPSPAKRVITPVSSAKPTPPSGKRMAGKTQP